MFWLVVFWVTALVGICFFYIFWEESKRSEGYSMLSISTLVAGYFMIKYYGNFNLNNFLIVIGSWVGATIIQTILKLLTATAYKEGLKEFNEEVRDYYKLKDKTDLSQMEERRLKYLLKNKDAYESRTFYYKRLRFFDE
ncbi:MAG TPA: hypothetical protein VF941_21630 [Clostridia bacterium]